MENTTLQSDVKNERTPQSTQAGRVLVVDDAQFLCEGLRRTLRVPGYEVVSANDGCQGLDLLRQMEFQAVITDLMMPNMDGVKFAQRLAEEFPTLPCIIMTGYATRERVLAVGRLPNVKAVLTKPLDHSRLIRTLAAVIVPAAGGEVTG